MMSMSISMSMSMSMSMPMTATAAPIVTGVSLRDLAPFLGAAAAELYIPRAVAQRACLRDVRRAPLSPTTPIAFGTHTHEALVGVDRVDALLRSFRLPARRHGRVVSWPPRINSSGRSYATRRPSWRSPGTRGRRAP